MHLTAVDDAAWDCPWRRRDVAEKVALSMGLVLTALMAPAWPGTVLVSLVSDVAIVALARIDAGVLARVMGAPLAFPAIGALSVAVSVGAPDTAATWGRGGPLSVGQDGLRRGAALTGHGIAGSLAVMVLATTTPMCDVFVWLRRCRVPDPLIEVASLTYRLLWVLLATTLGVREAQVARLGDSPSGPLGGLRRRIQAAGDGVASVMVRSWNQARRLEDGLAGRGHEGALRTLAPRRRRDPAFLLGTVACLAAIWAVSLTAPALPR